MIHTYWLYHIYFTIMYSSQCSEILVGYLHEQFLDIFYNLKMQTVVTNETDFSNYFNIFIIGLKAYNLKVKMTM